MAAAERRPDELELSLPPSRAPFSISLASFSALLKPAARSSARRCSPCERRHGAHRSCWDAALRAGVERRPTAVHRQGRCPRLARRTSSCCPALSLSLLLSSSSLSSTTGHQEAPPSRSPGPAPAPCSLLPFSPSLPFPLSLSFLPVPDSNDEQDGSRMSTPSITLAQPMGRWHLSLRGPRISPSPLPLLLGHGSHEPNERGAGPHQ